jgi:hypothetical protein
MQTRCGEWLGFRCEIGIGIGIGIVFFFSGWNPDPVIASPDLSGRGDPSPLS